MPWTMIPKALMQAGKFIVKQLMKQGPKLVKLGKKFTGKTSKSINKVGELLTKQKGTDVLGNTPKFGDIAKQQIKNTINKKFKGKGLSEKVTNFFNEQIARRTGFDFKKSKIKHKNIEILKKNNVPLSEILRMDKEGFLDSDDAIMKEYKNRKQSKNKISKELQNKIKDASNEFSKKKEIEFLKSENAILSDADIEKIYRTKSKKLDSVESVYENGKQKIELTFETKLARLDPSDPKYNERKAELRKNKLKDLKDLKLKTKLDEYRDAKMLTSQADMFKNMLVKSLAFNGKISEENANTVMKNVLNIIDNFNEKLLSELALRNEDIAEMIQMDHNLSREGLQKLADKMADLFDTNDLRNDEKLNKISNSIISESAGFINKQAEDKKKVDDALFESLKEMNEAAELRKKVSEEKSEALGEGASENDKLAEYGIGNVLKSQNSIMDMIMTSTEKTGGIDKIFDGALPAMMKSLGEDVGLWGTGLAIALKKIPETMMAGLSAVLNKVLAPLNKLLAPLGDAISGAFGWAKPYETPGWIESLRNVPVIGGLAGGLDWISSKVMGVPYAIKNMGENFANGDIGLGDIISNGLLGIPKTIMGGVSNLLLTVMGIPTDIMSSKEEMATQSDFEQKSHFSTAGDKNAHESSEKLSQSNIEVKAEEDVNKVLLDKPYSNENLSQSNIEVKAEEDVNKVLLDKPYSNENLSQSNIEVKAEEDVNKVLLDKPYSNENQFNDLNETALDSEVKDIYLERRVNKVLLDKPYSNENQSQSNIEVKAEERRVNKVLLDKPYSNENQFNDLNETALDSEVKDIYLERRVSKSPELELNLDEIKHESSENLSQSNIEVKAKEDVNKVLLDKPYSNENQLNDLNEAALDGEEKDIYLERQVSKSPELELNLDEIKHELPNSDLLIDNTIDLLTETATEHGVIDKIEGIDPKEERREGKDGKVTQNNTTIVQPAIIRESRTDTRVIHDSDAVFSTGDGL